MTGIILFGTFALMLLLSVPIALSLGVATMSTIALADVGVSFNIIAQRIFGAH